MSKGYEQKSHLPGEKGKPTLCGGNKKQEPLMAKEGEKPTCRQCKRIKYGYWEGVKHPWHHPGKSANGRRRAMQRRRVILQDDN